MRASFLHAVLLSVLLPACAAPTLPDVPEEFRGGKGWVKLSLDDFVNVNGTETTWTQVGDTIRCSGQPLGGARSKERYRNFELIVEWKHEQHAGNSGIFLWCPQEAFTDLPPGQLPRTGIEVQVLDLGYEENWKKERGAPSNWFTSHGDIFPVGEASMRPQTAKIDYRAADGSSYTVGSEDSSRSFPKHRLVRPAGQWNTYAIRAVDGEVSLWVNGVLVNRAFACQPAVGFLALEAEGAPVEFRKLRLRELP